MRSAARDRVAGSLEAGAVGPVLHATVDGVDDVRVRAEGAVPLPVRGRPPPGRCLEHQADGIRRDVVRRLRAPLPGHVVEGPPLVRERPPTPVEGHHDPEHVLPEELIHRARRDGRHALFGSLLVREVAVRVQALLRALVGLGCAAWNIYDPKRELRDWFFFRQPTYLPYLPTYPRNVSHANPESHKSFAK